MEKDAKDAGARDTRRSTTDNPRVTYSPRKDATPEGELAALANAYRFVIERAERKNVTETGNDKNTARVRHAGGTPEEPPRGSDLQGAARR